MNISEKMDYLFKTIVRFDHYINVANTKALGLITILVTLYVAIVGFYGSQILDKMGSLSDISFPYSISLIILIFISLFALFSFQSGLKVIFPDLRNFSPNNNSNYKSNIFFGDISSLTLSVFKNSISNLNSQIYLDDLENQVYTLAHVANDKFVHVNKSMKYFLYYFIPLSLIFILHYVFFLRA